METTSGSSSQESSYFISDSRAESTRLIEQERAFVTALGGHLPEQPDEAAFLAHMQRILDVACGSGGWALELAQTYPHLTVMGFDINEPMIHDANTQAQASGLNNASFRVMNAAQPLDYPDNFFDLVNGRWISVIGKAAWPTTIRELVRITRPGGTIRITESEDFGLTNSPAFEKLSQMFIHALNRAGTAFSPTGRTSGQTPLLARFLRDAGCQNIHLRPGVIDWSAGTQAHEAMVQDHKSLIKLMAPFLIKMGVTTREEFDQTYHDAKVEMVSDDFCALWNLLTVWGEKPS